jgi:hypothetical protein
MLRRTVSIILLIIVFATGIGLGWNSLQPPTPPSESDIDYPAYERMMTNLRAMTGAPHPPGSKELESVRAYLLEQIRAMGLEPMVEKATYTVTDVMDDMFERNGVPDLRMYRLFMGVLMRKPSRMAFVRGPILTRRMNWSCKIYW